LSRPKPTRVAEPNEEEEDCKPYTSSFGIIPSFRSVGPGLDE